MPPSSAPPSPPSRGASLSSTEDEDEEQPAAEEEERITTASEVRWADVQVDEAARRVQAAEEQLVGAKRALAERQRLHARLAEAHELRTSAAQSAQLLAQRTAEANQRRADAALACEQAKLAVKRRHAAQAALQSVQQRERAAQDAVAELQRQSLSSGPPSREGSSIASEEY